MSSDEYRTLDSILNIQDIVSNIDEDFDRPPMYDALILLNNMMQRNITPVLDNITKKYEYVGTIKPHINESETECLICLDNIKLNEYVYKLPCNHVFHDSCIEPWLKNNTTCPKCRYCLKDSVKTKK